MTVIPQLERDLFEAAERHLSAAPDAPSRPRRRPRLGHLAPVAAVLVVIAVAGVFLGLRERTPASGPAAGRGVRVVFTVAAGAGRLEHTANVFRARLRAVFGRAEVSATGGALVATVPDAAASARAEVIGLAAPGRLVFYDWEANVLLDNGKTIASQLTVQDPQALHISQGTASAPPGTGWRPLFMGGLHGRSAETLGRPRQRPTGPGVLRIRGPRKLWMCRGRERARHLGRPHAAVPA